MFEIGVMFGMDVMFEIGVTSEMGVILIELKKKINSLSPTILCPVFSSIDSLRNVSNTWPFKVVTNTTLIQSYYIPSK
jgi:hypothetical protein